MGGLFIKGLSGGERKRASIGYELITNPSLLLLDEPTSGLDSKTAIEIMKVLKAEAKRGMTIVSTIHQPSSDLFHLFDRVIILSEGYTIYNGKNTDIIPYLKSNEITMPPYTNPADFLIKLAIEPKLIDITLSI